MIHPMRQNNRKNHEAALRKVKQEAIKAGIIALNKMSIKNCIERYLRDTQIF
jgi:hypothetical protein